MDQFKVGRNRLANTKNAFQGNRKKVLCLCSAGLLRSPTMAWVLSNEPFGFNTRAAGCEPEYALIPLDPALVEWADEIVVMNTHQAEEVNKIQSFLCSDGGSYRSFFSYSNKPVHILEIEDNFSFRDSELVSILTNKAKNIWGTSLEISNELE